jgi:SAM-dependent methyltransferase
LGHPPDHPRDHPPRYRDDRGVVKLGTVDLDGLDFVPTARGHPDLPAGFFDRVDPSPDTDFYASPRLVTHIDRDAIDAVGRTYAELGIGGRVIDLMASWISHFRERPEHLVGVGLNAAELRHNRQLAEWHIRDLNVDPTLPFAADSYDHAVCCVSVDYLVTPVEVFAEVGRVLRPGGLFVVTFSDRCFPTKAIRGWLATDDDGHIEIVREYFRLAGAFEGIRHDLRTDPSSGGDPLYAVWARAR